MERYERAILGFVIGDAFGVPVEFEERDTFDIVDMLGYGSWNVPAGTWSDDSAMMLITMQHLVDGTTIHDLKQRFCDWAYRGYWTYNDKPSFDVGITIAELLNRWETKGIQEPARTDEKANGNGALMRILPIVLITYGDSNYEQIITKYASLTHGHIRSTLCCLHYTDVIHEILNGHSLSNALSLANNRLQKRLAKHPSELVHFIRLQHIEQVKREEIKSSGYVMHTLEAVYWSLLHSNDYFEAIHQAVHLGNDTDTIGAITGSIAGLLYDELNVPSSWLSMLPKYESITELIQQFNQKFSVN